MNAPAFVPSCDSPAALYRWTIALSERLAQMRLSFQGDLDAFLIFLIFAADTLRRSRQVPRSADGDTSQQPGGINALSVSEITGIPRETARRKLQSLITMGYVVRDASGLYNVDPRCNLESLLADFGTGAGPAPMVGGLKGRIDTVQDNSQPGLKTGLNRNAQ
jgi:hypothetical protein